MLGISAQIGINATAAEVFDFVSRVENMPRYLPTVEKATRVAPGLVRLHGAANGRRYAYEGRLRVDADARQMSWGAIERETYFGEFQVLDTHEGAELACRLELEPHLATLEKFASVGQAGENFIKTRLEAILGAVKQAVESRPKVPPQKSYLESAKKDDYKLVF
jgi:Polyketide cyclase / dehydrase and lipid transport